MALLNFISPLKLTKMSDIVNYLEFKCFFLIHYVGKYAFLNNFVIFMPFKIL